ncbi:carbon-nitrogen hydrolase family protein [Amycolatopsis sp. NPDC059090]|uniref:carbon-nitrogen hydrolase family protein n=1 Tax=unclassified Amycolatopsis TaxID=2618356 RepID=UPI00367350FE
MVRISVCQLTSENEPAENLQAIRKAVASATAEGARVVVFPEAAMARFGTPLFPLAEPIDGPWAKGLAQLADDHDVLVVAGMFTPADAGRVRNTLLVTGLGHHTGYDKIHLYDAFGFRESDTVAAGTEPLVLDVDGVKIGFATCYDVRFPELFRELADRGASIVVLPASWGAGEGKQEQWEVLVRARALDSGCWIVACDQADPTASGIETQPGVPAGIGCSMVVDGFGRVHAQLSAGPDTAVVGLDPEVAVRARNATGALVNRR